MKTKKNYNTKVDSIIEKNNEDNSQYDIKVISDNNQFNSFITKQLNANKVHVISDTHFYHKNIIKYTNTPSNRDEIMLKNWVNTVSKDDVIIHLGDLIFPSGKEKYENNLTYKLTGKKYLLKGNHDKLPTSWYEDQGYTVIKSFEIDYKDKKFVFTHRPGEDQKPFEENKIISQGPEYYNIHGHIHNNGYHNPIKHNRLINLSVEVIDFTPVKLLDLIKNIK